MADSKIEKIIPADPRLGRHIQHDQRSKRFAGPRLAPPRRDISWRRWGAKLNQGNVGACTGFAAAQCLNCSPLRLQRGGKKPTLDAQDAFAIYSLATRLDAFEGEWPDEDTGSSGIAACKAMKQMGLITRYEWAYGFSHGLELIQIRPLMIGTYWTEDMMNPNALGRVRPTGPDAGGHEYLWLGVEVNSNETPSTSNLCWFHNSWGREWGRDGYFSMIWGDFEKLIARDGDIISPIVR